MDRLAIIELQRWGFPGGHQVDEKIKTGPVVHKVDHTSDKTKTKVRKTGFKFSFNSEAVKQFSHQTVNSF